MPKAKKPKGPKVQDLNLDKIRLDGGTQPRDRIDPDLVSEYAGRMIAGDTFPPVTVWHDGTDYWPSDGFHRIKAAEAAGQWSIAAEIRKGTQADARWASVSANQTHGLRRSNADKERAVRLALAARPELSDGALGEHVGVDPKTVAKYRAELAATPEIPESTERTGLDGRKTDTAKIGKRKAAEPPVEPDPDPDTIPMGKPAAAPVVKDQLGQTLTGDVANAFGRRQEIQDLMTTVSKIKTAVMDACEAKDPLFAEIVASQFQADAGNLYRQLRAALPYAACPYCRQTGCKACFGRGYVGEFQYSAAPADLKAADAAAPPPEPEAVDPGDEAADLDPGEPLADDDACPHCHTIPDDGLNVCDGCGGLACDDCITKDDAADAYCPNCAKGTDA